MRLLITEQEKKDILSSYILIESVKQAKKYVELGLLSNDVLDKLISIDPSKTNKYVGWMSKIWMNEQPDLEQLRNTIEEYDVFLNKGKIKTKDINQFKTFKDLYSEVDVLNQSGESFSNKDLKSDYETIINNEDLLVKVPHTHEASRKLGLSDFYYEDKIPVVQQGSQWCTTYKKSNYFNCFYYQSMKTFYYVKVKSKQIIEELKKNFPISWERLLIVALEVYENGKIKLYDSYNYDDMSENEINKYLSIINLNKEILITRRSSEERKLTFKRINQKNIQEYIKNVSKGDLSFTSVDTLGDLTSVDGNLLLSNINSLDNLTFVNGNLEINSSPNLKNLGNLTSVKGNLTLRYVELNFKENPNCFGNLKYIGGNLDLGNMAMSSKMVTGKLSPMAFETEIRKIIEIKGKVIN